MGKFGELVGLRTGDEPIRVGLGVLLLAAMSWKRRREGAMWRLAVRTTTAVVAREGRGDNAAVAAVAAVGLGLAVYALAVSRRDAEIGQEHGGSGEAVAGPASAERMAGEGTPHDLEEASRAVRLRRDFGIVAPDQHLKHRFGIHNSSGVHWTLREIVNGCGCTAVELSAPSVRAGETEYVSVDYRPGARTHDDERKVVVLFHEATAPPVVLEVTAQVREALTVTPERISFRQLGKGQSWDAGFEVQNFSDIDWKGILLEPSQPWLSARAPAVDTLAKDARPRQLWRVTVRADSGALSPGEHRGVIVVKAVGPSGLTRDIRVCAGVTSPVTAIPGQVFFGKAAVGETVKARITVAFAPQAIPRSPEAVLVEHGLGDQLRVSWSKSEGEFWVTV